VCVGGGTCNVRESVRRRRLHEGSSTGVFIVAYGRVSPRAIIVRFYVFRQISFAGINMGFRSIRTRARFARNRHRTPGERLTGRP